MRSLIKLFESLFYFGLFLFFNIILKFSLESRQKAIKFRTQLISNDQPNPKKVHHICWIFDKNSTYQVLISFCSIIKHNPNDNFIFHFIIPPLADLDLQKFNHFINSGSKILIHHFQPYQASLPNFSEEKCRKSSIIIVKIWLKDILTDVDKVLYLDADMINTAPLSELWNYNLHGKTLAATNRIHLKKFWINSGFVYYNLDDLRKRPKRLFNCASKIYPCNVDDSWHWFCNRGKFLVVPYRYNVEFIAMIHKKKRTEDEIYEENHAVFYHLKDKENHDFYNIKRSELCNLGYVKQLKNILPIMEKLYDIREWVDSELSNAIK